MIKNLNYGEGNHLPIKKLSTKKVEATLTVKLKNSADILGTKDVNLLNIYLMTTFIKLAPAFDMVQKDKKIIPVEINKSLIENPMMYIYQYTNIIEKAVDHTMNPVYDVVHIPLDGYSLIRDLFFVIYENNSECLENYVDNLIELEILQKSGDDKYLSSIKLDSIMMNIYNPLKKLGKELNPGLYYHAFSTDPCSTLLNGGLSGNGHVVQIKVKKSSKFIRFYVNEYRKDIF